MGKTKKDKVNKEKRGEIGQEQLYDLLISRELSWQAIILDLIRTEQLDPWNIDLIVLARKYIERIQELQELEKGSFFISSKVLLAAAILLRIKSEILHENIKDIDALLFDKKAKIDEIMKERVIIDFAEEEIPLIIPRSPLPRTKKVTLQELMSALDHAINTEQRRIKKKLISRRMHQDIDVAVFPRPIIDVRKKIKEIYLKIRDFFLRKNEKLTFTFIAGDKREEKIATFIPLLHLDTHKKIYLEQQKPFDEIYIWMHDKLPEHVKKLLTMSVEKEENIDKVKDKQHSS